MWLTCVRLIICGSGLFPGVRISSSVEFYGLDYWNISYTKYTDINRNT